MIMERLLVQLEDVRVSSKEYFPGELVTAVGNGKEIIGLLNQTESDYISVKEYLDKGYWIVNNFLDGRPIGLGI